MEVLTDNEIHERLEALVARRKVDLTNIKYRGKLRTVKWNMYEANQKQHLLGSLDKHLHNR